MPFTTSWSKLQWKNTTTHIPLSLSLAIMLFIAPWKADTYRAQLTSSIVTSFPARHTTQLRTPTDSIFPPPQNFYFNTHSTNSTTPNKNSILQLPKVFQQPSHLTFHQMSLPKLQLLIPVTTPVMSRQSWHIHYHMKVHCRNLSQIYHMLPVNFQVDIPKVFQQTYHLKSHKRNLP